MSLGKGIKISSGFDLNSPSPLDNRTVFGSLYERDLLSEVNLYDGLICYVKENQLNYQYINGQWQEFKSTGDGVDKSYVDTELNKKAERIHGHDSLSVLYNNESDSNISTVKDALDKLLYFDLSINFSSGTSLTVEKGSTLTNVAFSWSYNKTIVSQSLNDINLDVGLRNYVYTSGFNSNKTFTLFANDGSKSFSRGLTFNFLNGRYWGVSSSLSYDSGFIRKLNKELSSSKNKTFTVDCGVGQYIFYCIPTSFGTATFTVGGFSGGFNKVETIEFTNSSGFTENYDIWKSTNSNLGTTTVVVS